MKAVAGCRTTSRRPARTNVEAAEAERAAAAAFEPELPMPELVRSAAQTATARSNARSNADPETERLRSVLAETLRELEALRALLT